MQEVITINENGEMNIHSYYSNNLESIENLISEIIIYGLKRPNNFFDEELRKEVRSKIQKGLRYYISEEINGNTYMTEI